MRDDSKQNLEQLFAAYAKNLPEKIDTIEKTWRMLCATSDEATLQDLLRLVHNLRGSAGVFGFPKVSEDAAKLEKVLEVLTSTPTAVEQKQVEALLGKLRLE